MKRYEYIGLAVVAIAMIPLAGFAETATIMPIKAIEPVYACTMDAKACPDGSYVGRTGPNCAWAPCPGETKPVQVQPPMKQPLPFGEGIKRGVTNDAIKDLQTVLKSDPSVYAGPVTGYYGAMTEAAVKKLQARSGLPQTGLLDTATQNVIMPYDTNVELVVVTPNGGETWKVGETQKITWKATFGPQAVPVPMPLSPDMRGSEKVLSTSDDALDNTASGQAGFHPTTTSYPIEDIRPTPAPFFPRATLTLLRDGDASFVRHLGTVNLYESSKLWTVPRGVPEAKDYRVRISFGMNTPCMYRLETEAAAQGRAIEDKIMYPCPMMQSATTMNTSANTMLYPYPGYSSSDTSDNAFAIMGGVSDDQILQLKRQLAEVQAMLLKLQEQVRILNAAIQALQQ